MSGLRDGERMSKPNNGTLMESPRLSETTTGNLTHLISNQMVTAITSDALLPTQDGGKSSDTRTVTLSTREAKLSKL
jgi:hypothetical protein